MTTRKKCPDKHMMTPHSPESQETAGMRARISELEGERDLWKSRHEHEIDLSHSRYYRILELEGALVFAHDMTLIIHHACDADRGTLFTIREKIQKVLPSTPPSHEGEGWEG